MLNLKRILVPVNFSPESMLAIEWAIKIARGEPDTSMLLCHVLPNPLMPLLPETIGFDPTNYLELERKKAEERLTELQRSLPPELFVTSCVRVGHVATEIERLCNQQAIDLVIMTTQGRRGLSHVIHGSTTEETARLIACPLLVLHLNRETKEATMTHQTPTIGRPSYIPETTLL